MPSAEPRKIEQEAGRWSDFAERMSEIRQATAGLHLGPTAFFPGGIGTEHGHYLKYQEYLNEVVERLVGGAIEFELIAITLRNIAASYEHGEEVTVDNFRVAEEELERATETHTPGPPG